MQHRRMDKPSAVNAVGCKAKPSTFLGASPVGCAMQARPRSQRWFASKTKQAAQEVYASSDQRIGLMSRMCCCQVPAQKPEQRRGAVA